MTRKQVEQFLSKEECGLTDEEQAFIAETIVVAQRHLANMPVDTLITSASTVPASYWDYPHSRHHNIGNVIAAAERMELLPIERVPSRTGKSGDVWYITIPVENS